MQNFAIEAIERDLGGVEYDLQESRTALSGYRERLAFLQDDIEETEAEVAFLEKKSAALREAMAKLASPLFEDRGSEPMAQWELELLSPFTIGQKLVVSTQHPFTKFHGKEVTVAKMVHNPNILEDFSWYVVTKELEGGEPLAIWANFLNEGA